MKDGVVVKHKARSVVKGYEQFTLEDLYAPVGRSESLRLFISICAAKSLVMRQADVSSAFLIGELGEDHQEFLELPLGYKIDVDRADYVLRLKQ